MDSHHVLLHAQVASCLVKAAQVQLWQTKAWTYPPAHFGLDETFIHVFPQQLAEGLAILALPALLLLLELLLDLCLLLVQIPVTDSTHIQAIHVAHKVANTGW